LGGIFFLEVTESSLLFSIMRKRILFLSLFLCFILPGVVCADIIYLHDGNVYSGKIILENSTFVRIDTLVNEDGRIKEFLLHEIKSIERGLMQASKPVNNNALAVDEDDLKEDPVEIISLGQEKGKQDSPSDDQPETDSHLSLTSEMDAMKSDIPVIAETLIQESSNQQDVINHETDDQQPAQREQKLEEVLKPRNMVWMGFKAVGLLLMVSAVPLLICGVLGFVLARKFDNTEVEEEEVVETIVQRSPYNSPYPTQEVPQVAKKMIKSEKRGGLIRRIIARGVDLYLGVGMIMVLYSLPGLIVPLDQYAVFLMLVIMLPLMLLFFFYFFIGIGKFKNTYGRYLVGVRVVDAQTGGKPSLGQAFKRDVLLFLWPIDFFVLMFNKSKRRIGDSWAQTKVVVVPSQTSGIMRIVPGLILGISIYTFIPAVSPFVNDRMIISQVAKDYLASEYGADQLTRPRRVEIFNNTGKVNVRLKNGKSYSVHLMHYKNGWAVRRIQEIPEVFLGKGFSINYSSP